MHRLYENKDITVFWNSEKCVHAKECVHGSPSTFDPMRRPWIDLGRADTSEIWQSIAKCPSGALSIVYNHDVRIVFEEVYSRSAAYDGDKRIGECDYQVTDDGWIADHTEVDPEYKGKKIARRLVYCVMEEAERRKINVIPVCPYVKKTV